MRLHLGEILVQISLIQVPSARAISCREMKRKNEKKCIVRYGNAMEETTGLFYH